MATGHLKMEEEQTNFMEQSPFEKPVVAQLVKKSPAFYGTRMCIIVFTGNWSIF
jgi:hypothetical protein